MNSLIERVKKYLATHTDISQEKLAKQIGISRELPFPVF